MLETKMNSPQFLLCMPTLYYMEQGGALSQDIMSALPVHALLSFALEDLNPWPRDNMKTFFCRTTSLQSLSLLVSEQSVTEMCSMLMPPTNTRRYHARKTRFAKRSGTGGRAGARGGAASNVTSVEPERPLVLPALESIDLDSIDFSQGSSALGKGLMKLLKARKTARKAVRSVGIMNCSITNPIIEDLEKVVPDLRWDSVNDRYDEGMDDYGDYGDYDEYDEYGDYGGFDDDDDFGYLDGSYMLGGGGFPVFSYSDDEFPF